MWSSHGARPTDFELWAGYGGREGRRQIQLARPAEPRGLSWVQKSQTLPVSSHGTGTCLPLTLEVAALARGSDCHALMGREAWILVLPFNRPLCELEYIAEPPHPPGRMGNPVSHPLSP